MSLKSAGASGGRKGVVVENRCDSISPSLMPYRETVGAADGLKEAVVLHGLVDVEVGAGRRVKAGDV